MSLNLGALPSPAGCEKRAEWPRLTDPTLPEVEYGACLGYPQVLVMDVRHQSAMIPAGTKTEAPRRSEA